MAEIQSRSTPTTNGTHPSNAPIELSIGLPSNPGTRIHVHLTIIQTCLTLWVASAALAAGSTGAVMGSLVFALPNRYDPSESLTSTLYSQPSSIDFVTRLSKALVRRTGKPCYVGGSINLADAAGGGTVEEEFEAFRAIVQVVTTECEKASKHTD